MEHKLGLTIRDINARMIGAPAPLCDCRFCKENNLEIRFYPLCSNLINLCHIRVLFQIVPFQRHSPGVFKLVHYEHVVDNLVELRPELVVLRVQRSQALVSFLQYVPFAPPVHSLTIDFTYSHLHSSVLICQYCFRRWSTHHSQAVAELEAQSWPPGRGGVVSASLRSLISARHSH